MFTTMNLRKPTLCVLAAILITSTRLEAAELNQAFPIRGTVPDVRQTTSASGTSLQVHFQQIQYSGNVAGATIEKVGDGYYVAMRLQNVVLRIGRTDIRGGYRVGAVVGPMDIHLGTREDLQVKYRVAIERNDIRVLNTSVRLAHDNYRIGRPANVSTSGFGVTQQRVVNGLQQGLRNNLASIERILIEESRQILLPMKASILAYVIPQSTPDSESDTETEITKRPSESNHMGSSAERTDRFAGSVRRDSDNNDLPAMGVGHHHRLTPQPVASSPPVGDSVYCPPPKRLGYRVRTLFRGTLGIFGLAY